MSKKTEETIKEKVLEKVEEAKETVEATKEKPTKEEGSFKIKKVTKPKQLGDDKLIPDLVKVDLSKLKKKNKMPFKSEKQRKWLWANKPEIALRWTNRYQSPAKFLNLKKKK